MVIAGYYLNPNETRFWANYLLSNFYFLGICLFAVAWIAIQYMATAGWFIALKRIPEAMGGYIPVMLVSMLVFMIFGAKHVYCWLDLHSTVFFDNKNHEQLEILKGKSGFLNQSAFMIRFAVYFLIWIFFSMQYRKYSKNEDMEPGFKWYKKSYVLSCFFLPLFGLSFCLAAFDWLMSIEPLWYSTVFGVYIFVGSFVSCMCIIVIIATLLKRAGYMSYVNSNHFHDLGKFMFGFSVFWQYIWVAQFLLIWYANLPEEIHHFYFQMHGNWFPLFIANILINFATPFFMLIMRDAKRTNAWLVSIASIMLCGRYVDWYLVVMPGSVGNDAGFGLMEIGFMLFYIGVFAYTVAYGLSRANLVVKNHPLVAESLHHSI